MSGWPHLDPALQFLFPAVFDEEQLPILESIGYPTSDASIEIQVTGDEPVNEQYSVHWDKWRMGSGSNPIFPGHTLPSVRAERPVLHSSWYGQAVSTAEVTDPLYKEVIETIDRWGIPRPPRYVAHRTQDAITYSSGIWSLPVPDNGNYLGFPFELHALFDKVEGHEMFIRDSYPGLPRATVGTWSFAHGRTPYFGEFHGEFRSYVFSENPSPSNKRYWALPFTIQLEIDKHTISYPGLFPGPGTYDFARVTFAKLSYSFGTPHNVGSPYSVGTVFDFFEDNPSFDVIWETPSVAATRPLEPGALIERVDDGFNSVYRMAHIGGQLHKLVNDVNNDTPNVYPGLFYSAADAINKHISVLQANNLENLSQLSGMGDLIPNAAKFVKLISEVKNGKWAQAGMTLLDAWSEAQLQWSFGAKPTLADVTELQRRMEGLKAALDLQGLWGQRDLRGSFSILIPGGRYGRDQVLIQYQSKCIVTFDYSGLLATLIRGNAIGLLPKLSNLWDMVPFSFLLDWFFNIGERLGDVDSQMFMLCLPVHYCTHSVTITSVLSESELDNLGLSTVGIDTTVPGLRYYQRVTSRYLPRLRDSAIDFRAPAELNVLNAGALALCLMK
jgi:hypothetical protein